MSTYICLCPFSRCSRSVNFDNFQSLFLQSAKVLLKLFIIIHYSIHANCNFMLCYIYYFKNIFLYARSTIFRMI